MKSAPIPFLLLVLQISVGNCEQSQFIRFWNESSCVENHSWELKAASDWFRAPGKQALGYVVNGLWSIRTCNGSFCSNAQIIATQNCASFLIPSSTVTINVSRFGDESQTERKIHLFSLSRLQGAPEVVDENGITFQSPRNFSSYFFTGRNSWKFLNEDGEMINYLSLNSAADYGIKFSLSSTTLRNVSTIVFDSTPPTAGTTIATTTITTTTTIGIVATTSTYTPGSSTVQTGNGNTVKSTLMSYFIQCFAVMFLLNQLSISN